MHVPKTAGTSLRHAIEAVTPRRKIFNIYDDPAFTSNSELESYSSLALNSFDIVSGHFKFGAHKHTGREFVYIAIIRDPFEYLRSFFFFQKYVVKDGELKDKGIIEGLNACPTCQVDNCFTRYFSGCGDAVAVNRDHLLLAFDNITKHFAFVGTLDFARASFSKISEYLGVDLVLPKENVTPLVAERKLLDVELFRRGARKLINYDLELYDFVLDRFWGGSNRRSIVDHVIGLESHPALDRLSEVSVCLANESV